MTLRTTIVPFMLFVLLCAPLVSYAEETSELTALPVVVDEKAKARDILKETITITNNGQRKLTLYPSVNDVSPQEGQEAFVAAQGGADRKDSLANWIEISRGVIELNPGESREVPFVIRVNLNALPGTYHADISFYQGSTRPGAEATRPLAVVTVNTEVQADIKEAMQLNKFITDSFFFSGDDVLFSYQVQNIGNQELKPKGEIRIYDRKGREVASVPVNADGKSLTPDQESQLASAWSGAKGFGKFKAFLNIDYGNNQSGTLQDTVFFWIIPWQQLVAIFVVSFIAIIVSALYFHKWLEHRHMQRFAMAGMAAGAALPTPPGMLVPQKPLKPIAPIMPAPDLPKPAKKSFFARFKRTPKPESVASTVPEPVHALTGTEVKVVQEPEHVIPAAPAPRPTGTINLASGQMDAPARRQAGHVINLKDGA
jgi:hypothetical protein